MTKPLKSAPSTARAADAQRTAEEPPDQVAPGRRSPGLVDDVVLVVEALDVAGCAGSRRARSAFFDSAVTWSAITGVIATRKSATAMRNKMMTVRDGDRAAQPVPLEELDGGLSPAARKSDDDEHQRGADGLDVEAQPDRRQRTEAADEADVERCPVVQRRARLAQVVPTGGDPVVPPRRPPGCSLRALLRALRASVTSSLPNPATTSQGGELGRDGVAALADAGRPRRG